jgi:O-acetyl-ADP-ribose deacetylase (regulator of RNase III)
VPTATAGVAEIPETEIAEILKAEIAEFLNAAIAAIKTQRESLRFL